MMTDCTASRVRSLFKRIKRELSESEKHELAGLLSIHLAVSGPVRVGVFNRPEISITEHGKRKSIEGAQ